MAETKNTKSKNKALTKSAVYQEIATKTNLTRKQVTEVFDALTEMIKKELSKKGPGQFTLPGLLKLKLVKKPATKEKVVDNPFKPGEKMTVKAKPARNQIKPRVLKTLSAMVQ